jgi:hypothetical protein
MAKEYKVMGEEIRLPYKWALGPVFSRFFDELKDKKIMGTKCPKCQRVLIPARRFCPRCFEETTEWVQVSDEGTIRTWSLINFEYAGQIKKPPYVQGLIDLEGADTALAHLIGGVDVSDLEKVKEQVRIGMRVKAKWKENREGNIFDIECFEPI